MVRAVAKEIPIVRTKQTRKANDASQKFCAISLGLLVWSQRSPYFIRAPADARATRVFVQYVERPDAPVLVHVTGQQGDGRLLGGRDHGAGDVRQIGNISVHAEHRVHHDQLGYFRLESRQHPLQIRHVIVLEAPGFAPGEGANNY